MTDDSSVGAAPTAPRRPRRSAKRQFAATMLVLEAFVVFFATLVANGLRLAPADVVWPIGAAFAVSLVVVAGLLRWPGGYLAGSVLQVLLVAVGVVVAEIRDVMLVVALVFVALWVASLRLGSRIDRERAEREEAEREHAARGDAGSEDPVPEDGTGAPPR